MHIAFGVSALSVAMMAVFLALGKFDGTVFLGALLGIVLAVLNFFLLGLAVQKATLQDDPEIAKKMIQLSYSRRLLMMGIGIIVGIIAPCFHWVAVVCPLIFSRITIFFMQVIHFKGKGEN